MDVLFQTLNQRAGEGRHSGVMMWPGGSDQVYQNVSPTFSMKFNSSVPFYDRIDHAVQWIIHPDTPANLVFLYFEVKCSFVMLKKKMSSFSFILSIECR